MHVRLYVHVHLYAFRVETWAGVHAVHKQEGLLWAGSGVLPVAVVQYTGGHVLILLVIWLQQQTSIVKQHTAPQAST